MRQIILDTETTGLEPEQGHRIIEIGCIEIVNRRRSERLFHRYLNPGRAVDGGALEVHGLREEFLRDKPRFADVAAELLEFVRGAEVLIHNAPFDVAFLNAELRASDPALGRFEDYCSVSDTLELARRLHPGQRNSLDALCKRYQVDNSARTLHGALLDAEILLDVYLAMTGGQAALSLDAATDGSAPRRAQLRTSATSAALVVIRASAAERAEHEQRLTAIRRVGGRVLWSDAGSASTEPDG
jgi:DNA polymerase-3 subunit epsilon